MGQASKRLPTRPISGRLGLKRIGLYKEMAPVKNGAGNLGRKGEKEKNALYLDKLE